MHPKPLQAATGGIEPPRAQGSYDEASSGDKEKIKHARMKAKLEIHQMESITEQENMIRDFANTLGPSSHS